VVLGASDDILLHAEKAANAAGARALGFGDGAKVVEAIRSGAVEGLVVLGHDILDERHLGGIDELGRLDTLIVADLRQSRLQSVADVVFPTLHAAEKLGTLTNFDGRVQRIRPLVQPAWEAYSEGEVVSRLAVAMGLPGFEAAAYAAADVSRELARSEPAFAGIDLDSLGSSGAPLIDFEPAGDPD
jgi:predicted molibdopterin-dependent oxidoreductase YjgC